MLGMPLTIEEFGIEKLIDGEIIGCDLYGRTMEWESWFL